VNRTGQNVRCQALHPRPLASREDGVGET